MFGSLPELLLFIRKEEITMTEKRKNISLKNEKGVVIVEATFVFPIMFIILFFLIYFGNAFYEKAQIEKIVVEKAIEGAGYCADPLLQTLKNGGSIPSVTDKNNSPNDPYRYIFGGMGDIEKKISNDVKTEIGQSTFSFFTNMKPDIKTDNIARFNNYFIYSTFSVEVTYQIKFPIRFLGRKTPPVLTISSRAEVPVTDSPEFIRNTDMVIEMFQGTKFGKSIQDIFGKINDFISNFAKK